MGDHGGYRRYLQTTKEACPVNRWLGISSPFTYLSDLVINGWLWALCVSGFVEMSNQYLVIRELCMVVSGERELGCLFSLSISCNISISAGCGSEMRECPTWVGCWMWSTPLTQPEKYSCYALFCFRATTSSLWHLAVIRGKPWIPTHIHSEFQALDPNSTPTLAYSKIAAQSLDNAQIESVCMRPFHTSYR